MQGPIAKYLRANLAAAALLAMTMAALTAMAQAQPRTQKTGKDPILGTWLVTVAAYEGQPSFIVYEVYSSGGSLSAIDNQAAPSEETPAFGTWRKVGARKYYEDQYQLIYDNHKNFVGTWIGHIEDDIDASGTVMPTAPFTWEIVDINGNVVDSGSGMSSAVKLPEPQGPKK